MTNDPLNKTIGQVRAALPLYLTAQVITLLMTFLDTPAYMAAFRAKFSITVTPWVGLWLVLVVFGISIGIFLLVFKRWRSALPEKERGDLVAGYFLGAIAGLLTFGLRFSPLMAAPYFAFVGLLALILIVTYTLWRRRRSAAEAIFP